MKNNEKYISGIILAAGSSSRMGGDISKQCMSILGESVLYRSVKAFCDCEIIDEVAVVCRADEIEWAAEELGEFEKVCIIVPGGKSRAESAVIGYFAASDYADYLVFHDAARCLITPEQIEAVVKKAFIHRAASATTSITDTIKGKDDYGFIIGTLDRERLLIAQTPQAFEREIYSEAITLVKSMNINAITDDNMLIEQLKYKIYPVETGKQNIKITTREDVDYAEFILRRRGE